MSGISGYLPELYMGLSSLMVHKLRSLLTMLGMIFGVGAVVAMLSITAGAQKEMISFIDLLGVNNIIIEAKEVDRPRRVAGAPRHLAGPDLPRLPGHRRERAGDPGVHAAQALQAHQAAAEDQPGTAAVDRRAAELPGDQLARRCWRAGSSPRRTTSTSAPVCVLGETAKVNLLGYDRAVGKYVKVNNTWLQVIGVLAHQATARHRRGGRGGQQPQQPHHRAAQHRDAAV